MGVELLQFDGAVPASKAPGSVERTKGRSRMHEALEVSVGNAPKTTLTTREDLGAAATRLTSSGPLKTRKGTAC